jgi:hypothetical protein
MAADASAENGVAGEADPGRVKSTTSSNQVALVTDFGHPGDERHPVGEAAAFTLNEDEEFQNSGIRFSKVDG